MLVVDVFNFFSDRESLTGAKFTKSDVSAALALCMAAKEESEITTIKKACQVSVDIFSKYLKEQIMDIIDNDKVSQILKLLYYQPGLVTNSILFC